MEWALSAVPFVLSTGTVVVIARRYAIRVSYLWCALFVAVWFLLQSAGTIGFALGFDAHMSLFVAILGVLWLFLFLLLLLRRYHVSMCVGVLVILVYAAAASHAFHTVDHWPVLLALLDVAPAMWAAVSLCFSFSLSLLSAAAAERSRRKDDPTPSQLQQQQQQVQQVQQKSSRQLVGFASGIFMNHMRRHRAEKNGKPAFNRSENV